LAAQVGWSRRVLLHRLEGSAPVYMSTKAFKAEDYFCCILDLQVFSD
jgi:hypothetical protein